jgi:hypothetical protein
MEKIKSESDLVRYFIENSIYNDIYDKNDEIKCLQEFVIPDGYKRNRVDLLLLNYSKEKIALIEFKNRKLCPNDFFQIAKYYRDFLRIHDYEPSVVECYLIGKHTTSKSFNSMISMGIESLKVYFFYEDEDKIKLHNQDKFYSMLDLW